MSEEAAEAALMASFEPPANDEGADGNDPADPSNDPEGPDPDPLDDGEEGDEGNDDPDDGDEAGDPPAPQPLTDDAEVEVLIGGEAQKVTLGSLKALAGQEAELTRQGREIEMAGGQAAATLQVALEMVEEELAPYADIDWLVAQQNLEPELFQWHRQQAAKLADKYRKLTDAAKGFEQTFTERRSSVNEAAKAAATRELSADVPGWNDAMHQEVLAYGATQGLDAAELATVTNAKVLKLIRKAMLHDRAEKVATQKVNDAPTKVIKGGNRQPATTAKAVNAKKAIARLEASGSSDDAVAALMGRWG
jgi:hypothetical protein